MHVSAVLSLLLAIITSPSALALFKLQPESGNLVENAKEGVVYLFQFPRTSNTPSQAALNLKVEAWLKWSNIPFYRISNQFFLGSRSTGAAPFALYNGEFIDGSDKIIEVLGRKFESDREERKLRRAIDDKLFKFLMADRASRTADDVGGLDWMVSDEGIVQQMVPLLVSKKMLYFNLANRGTFKVLLNSASLEAYFNAYSFVSNDPKKNTNDSMGKCSEEQKECRQIKIDFLTKFCRMERPNGKSAQFTFDDWLQFDNAIRAEVIVPALQGIFKEKQGGANSSEAKLDRLLERNSYKLLFGICEETYSTLKGKGDEILDAVKYALSPIIRKLKKESKGAIEKSRFPIGDQLSPLDASLFGALVQFFETPLNNEALQKYFQPRKNADPKEPLHEDVRVLKDYVRQAKNKLELGWAEGRNKWEELTKKPWLLNYEDNEPKRDSRKPLEKFAGPFNVEPGVDELENILEVLNADGTINEKVLRQYPGSVQAAVRSCLIGYMKNVWEKYSEKNLLEDEAKTNNLKKFLLRGMSAYICNGSGKSGRGECALKHVQPIREKKSEDFFWNYIHVARLYTYKGIMEYNENLVKKNVLAAIAAARKAGAVSPLEVGNEQ